MASPHTRHVTRWIFFLPEFQHHIEEMLNEGHTNPQIVATLTRLGLKTSIRSLQQFLKSSGLHRPSSAVGLRVGDVSDELADAVNYLSSPSDLPCDSLVVLLNGRNRLRGHLGRRITPSRRRLPSHHFQQRR